MPKVKEAIILVGGLGTRLKSVVSDKPKPLAEVAGKAFIEHLLDLLIANNIERVIFALGYMSELITEHFKNGYKNLELVYALEEKKLDTGGAIVNALTKSHSDTVLVLNGDSYCSFNLNELEENFSGVDMQLSTIKLNDISRYGALDITDDYLNAFQEKGQSGSGFINAGIYLLNKNIFANYQAGDVFSFEKDFMPSFLTKHKAKVKEIDASNFIDIGTPEDYKRAQSILGKL